MAWVDHDYYCDYAELTTIAFYSLQSGIMDMAYAVYSKSSSLHGNCYNLNTVNSSLIMCDCFVKVNNSLHPMNIQAPHYIQRENYA